MPGPAAGVVNPEADPAPEDTGGAVVVMVSCPPADAARLAEGLVAARLAACVQRLTIDSTYRWQEAVESAPETLLLCKTVRARVPALGAWLAAHHPYELPERVVVEALPPPLTSAAYADWVAASVAPGAAPDGDNSAP